MSTHADIIRSLRGTRVTVVGGGVSGLGAAKLLLAHGAHVRVSDSAPRDKVRADLLALPVDFEFGGHTDVILDSRLLVLSPGVDPRHPVLATARAQGIPCCGEVELAYCLLSRKPRIVAITGTNGKTTTTSLVGHIAAGAGKKVFIGGNIGEPLSTLAMPEADPVDIAVLELSSYQCEGLITFDADVAVWLNLTPDHLERYRSVADYAAAKAHLFALQNAAHVSVLNAEDPFCKAIDRPATAWFSVRHLAQCTYTLEGTPLLGMHNRENQLAAIAACEALAMSHSDIQRGLDTFGGVEHRIEKVAVQNGVTWFNDSKGTNDDAASKAIAAVPAPIVWLAGGKDKGGGYDLSAAAARGKVKHTIVFGASADLIADAMAGVCPVTKVVTLPEAVTLARTLATTGDSVLLSPACASFDQFKNYEERGRIFKRLVMERQ